MRRRLGICLGVGWILASSCGCATFRLESPSVPQSSLCQELLAESARRAVAQLELNRFRGKTVSLRVSQAAGEFGVLNTRYVEELVIKEMNSLGGIVVPEAASPEVSAVCLVDVGGVHVAVTTFPPRWIFFAAPLSYMKGVTARVVLELFSSRRGDPGSLWSQPPVSAETGYREHFILGLGPIRSFR